MEETKIMLSLISDAEKNYTAEIFTSIFNTWSRPIIVYKEPVKTLISPQDSNALFGFGNSQSTELYNYTPITGIFQALVAYQQILAPKKEDNVIPEIDGYTTESPISIKVRCDAKDFISNGRTEKINVDGNIYFLKSPIPKPQIFWNNEFYIYDLEEKI